MANPKEIGGLHSLNEEEDFPLKKLENRSAFCKVCELAIGATVKSQLKLHLDSTKHCTNTELKKQS